MRRFLDSKPRSILLIALLALGTLASMWAATVSATEESPIGLINPGFETGAFPPWIVTSEAAAGSVTLTQRDDATKYPVFALVGTTVTPRTGDWMARFGLPKDKNNHQPKGVSQLKQTFLSDGKDIGVAYRVFTWEHRDSDAFVIDVRLGDGTDPAAPSVGRLADREIQDITATSIIVGTGTLPYTLSFFVEPREKYKDTLWQDVRITDLPGTPEHPQTLTIYYTLDTNTDAAHDTWVYLDMADIVPPAITVTSPPPGGFTNDSTPAIAFTVTDESGLALGWPMATLDGAPLTITPGTGSDQWVGTPAGPLADGSHAVQVTAKDVFGNKGVASSTFTVDTVAPAAPDISPPGGPFTGSVDVTLTYEDGGSAYYTLDTAGTGSPPTAESTPYTGSFQIVESAVLKCLTIDKAGNPSPIATASFTKKEFKPTFSWGPENPQESDLLNLCAGYQLDSSGNLVADTWAWDIETPDGQVEAYSGPVGFICPAMEGDYTVTLKVTLPDDPTLYSSDTVTIHVANSEPRLNALNIETLPGQPVKLVGRFLDPGWGDEHTAAWTVDDVSAATTLDEDGLAVMSSGYVEGLLPPRDGDAAGTLAVDDGTAITTADFNVDVIDPFQAQREPNNRFHQDDALPALNSDGAYLSYIQTAGDVDIFEVRMSTGSEIPAGTEVLATLRDLPSDYDLAIFQGAPDAVQQDGSTLGSSLDDAPWARIPFDRSPWARILMEDSPWARIPVEDAPWARIPWARIDLTDAPWARIPILDSPWARIPWARIPWARIPVESPWARIPWARIPVERNPWLQIPYLHLPQLELTNGLNGYPLSRINYTGLPLQAATATDLKMWELGFDNADLVDMVASGFSANGGVAQEAVLARMEGSHLYVAVVGHNGAHSDQPYTLQLETSTPVDLLEKLNERVTNTPLEPPAGSDVPLPAVTPSGVVKTLFVIQADRMVARYGDRWDPVVAQLEFACGSQFSDLVGGKVVSVPNDADYRYWDEHPYDVSAANRVTENIRGIIQQELSDSPTIQYVVIVGSDEIVPFRRVADETSLGNEREYPTVASLNDNSPLLASMVGENVLTDDFYVDREPSAFDGGYLYLPDVAVSRLVEEPEDIAAAIAACLANNGQMQPQTAVVSAYDFMTDGAARLMGILGQSGAGLQVTPLVSDDWSAQNLKDAALGTAVKDVGSLNAHFTHYAGISPIGYQMLRELGYAATSELFTGQDVADSSDLTGKLVFSMGCHAGLNVPDAQVDPAGTPLDDPDQSDVRIPDLTQAMMAKGAVYLASTGTGYGDDAGIAGTEALISIFAEELTNSGKTVGQALADAKRRYIGSLSALTSYDEKSVTEFTLYGMPQYRYDVPNPAENTTTVFGVSGALGIEFAAFELNADPPDPPAGFDLQVVEVTGYDSNGDAIESVLYSQSYDYDTVAVDDFGYYLTADGDSQATQARPIQPRVVIPIEDILGGSAAGAVMSLEGTYVDLPGFDPAISRWTTEWESDPQEYQVAMDGWWPADAVWLTSIDTGTASQPIWEQRLVINPGQFYPDVTTEDLTETNPTITGTERVWETMKVRVTRAAGTSSDGAPPTVQSVGLIKVGDTVTATVNAYDGDGIAEITFRQINNLTAQAFPFPSPAGGPVYSLSFDLPGVPADEVEVWVDVVDGAGMATTLTAKANGFGAASTGLISRGSVTQGNSDSFDASLSPDGRYVVFTSDAGNLIGRDLEGQVDVFVYDSVTGIVQRVSDIDASNPANGDSFEGRISGDGRYVAFESEATDFVASWEPEADNNGASDIYVGDLQTGETRRISLDTSGTDTDGPSSEPSISDNGRYVAFSSWASDLVPSDTNGAGDVFVRDRDADGDGVFDETDPGGTATVRVSVDTAGLQTGGGRAPSMSADGRYVAFHSDAADLVAAGEDTNGTTDVFVHDRDVDEDGVFDEADPGATSTVRVSVSSDEQQADGASNRVSISADGRFAAFVSLAATLVPDDTGGFADIFVRDLASGITHLASTSSEGAFGDADCATWSNPSLSADGRYITFISSATNLAPNDTNGSEDVFVRDLVNGITNRVSLTSSGTQVTGGAITTRISGDGHHVVFHSMSSGLVDGDTNGVADVFVRNLATGATTRASVTSGGPGGNSNSCSEPMYEGPSVTADGRFIVYLSAATNLVPGDSNAHGGMFVYDSKTGTTDHIDWSVAVDGSIGIPSVSDDGRFIAFNSTDTSMVPGDSNGFQDVFVYDRDTHTAMRATRAYDGGQPDNYCEVTAISSDGRYVLYDTWATNILAIDNTSERRVYLFDRETQETEPILVGIDGQPANGGASWPSISADGRYVAFSSSATNLVADDIEDTNGMADAFVYDRQEGTTQRVSIGHDGQAADGETDQPVISADGRFVAFLSSADNLVPGVTSAEWSRLVYVFDRQTGVTELVSAANDGTPASDGCEATSISADGRHVMFTSFADNLVPDGGDTNGTRDVFVRDRLAGTIERVSVGSDGSEGNSISASSRNALSADGRTAVFMSDATNLVAGDTLGWCNVFVRYRW